MDDFTFIAWWNRFWCRTGPRPSNNNIVNHAWSHKRNSIIFPSASVSASVCVQEGRKLALHWLIIILMCSVMIIMLSMIKLPYLSVAYQCQSVKLNCVWIVYEQDLLHMHVHGIDRSIWEGFCLKYKYRKTLMIEYFYKFVCYKIFDIAKNIV